MPRVALIGTGMIGASIGLGLKANGGSDLEVVGCDLYRDNAVAAERIRAVDRVEGHPARAVQDASLVIIATPILAIREVMEAIAEAVMPGVVVTDTGSTKREVLRWASQILPDHAAFVGGHPMAGKTDTGPEAADATLFHGAQWIVSAPPRTVPDAVDVVSGVARALGANPQFMDAGEHDAYVAAISHLPMLAAMGLFRLARSSEAWPELSVLASSGFKDTTRLAATDPAMAHDIAITNREQIIGWLQRYRAVLRDLEQELANTEDESLFFRQISETNLQYTAFREGVVGRREVHDGMLDDLPESGMMDLLLPRALTERAKQLQRHSEERLAESERQLREGGRGGR